MALALMPGFADPVRDQQAAFRAVMDALSRPGRIIPYRNALEQAGPLGANAVGIALTLLDFEVRYHLSASLEEAEAPITFHTGSRRTAEPAEADFAFLDLATDRLDISAFAQGVPDYPDRSTTLFLCCQSLVGGVELTLRGPGIASAERMAVPGLPADFVAQWHANSMRMPLGADLVFVSDEGLLGLPRSTRIIGEVL
jgi:alpha-D-ribose 1-methylphosphonate 5-triphosphate synthase subunit PhnH